jgi:hypothetical protein
MKKGATAAKGKKQSKKSDPTKALSKLARTERKAERRVAALRALLVKAEKKLAKHAARAAALVSGAIAKPETSVAPPPVPVAVESSAAKDDGASASMPYKGERETPPSAPAPKRSAVRSVNSGTAPAPPAKRAAPNHTARKGNQIEAPAPSEKDSGDE